jgi:hypothetical protein
MRLLKWLKSRFQMAPINRVAAVDVGDETITFRWAGGSTSSLRWENIERVVIRTTDAGPFDDDVFFVVQAAGTTYVIPQGAAGTNQLRERLQQLPDFDNEAIINSMGCTDNQEFVCWEREWTRRGGRPTCCLASPNVSNSLLSASKFQFG